LIKDM